MNSPSTKSWWVFFFLVETNIILNMHNVENHADLVMSCQVLIFKTLSMLSLITIQKLEIPGHSQKHTIVVHFVKPTGPPVCCLTYIRL